MIGPKMLTCNRVCSKKLTSQECRSEVSTRSSLSLNKGLSMENV